MNFIRTYRKQLAAIGLVTICCVVAIQYFRVSGLEIGFGHDSLTYLVEVNLLLGRSYFDTGEWGFFRGPIYPLFLTLVKAITQEHFFMVIALLQFILAMVMAGVGYLLMRKRVEAYWSALMMLGIFTWPDVLNAFKTLNSEVLFLPLFTYLLCRIFWRQVSTVDLILAALLCWVRESGVVLYLGYISLIFVNERGARLKTKAMGVALSLSAAILPYLLVERRLLMRGWDLSKSLANLNDSLIDMLTQHYFQYSLTFTVLVIMATSFKREYRAQLFALLSVLIGYILLIFISNLFVDGLITFRSRLLAPIAILLLFILLCFKIEGKWRQRLSYGAIGLIIILNLFALKDMSGYDFLRSRAHYRQYIPKRFQHYYLAPYLTNAPDVMNVISDQVSLLIIFYPDNPVKTKRAMERLILKMEQLGMREIAFFEMDDAQGKYAQGALKRNDPELIRNFRVERFYEGVPMTLYLLTRI